MPNQRVPPTTVDALPHDLISVIFSHVDPNLLPQISTVSKQWRKVFFNTCAQLTLQERKDYAFDPSGMEKISSFVYSFTCLRSLHVISGSKKICSAAGHGENDFLFEKGFPDSHLRGMIYHVRRSIKHLKLAYRSYFFRIWIDLAKCLYLENLHLQNVWIDAIPEDRSPLLRLQICCLSCATVAGSALAELVNMCPLLKHLELKSCSRLNEVFLTSEKLEVLKFTKSDVTVLNLHTPRLYHLHISDMYLETGTHFQLDARNSCTLHITGNTCLDLEMQGTWDLSYLPRLFAFVQDKLNSYHRVYFEQSYFLQELDMEIRIQKYYGGTLSINMGQRLSIGRQLL